MHAKRLKNSYIAFLYYIIFYRFLWGGQSHIFRLSGGSGIDQINFSSPFPSWNSQMYCCQILEIKPIFPNLMMGLFIYKQDELHWYKNTKQK